jgi:phosphoglycolate phosphatase
VSQAVDKNGRAISAPKSTSDDCDNAMPEATVSRIGFDVIVFDLDGTLADTAPDLTAALNHALEIMGQPTVTAESVKHLCGDGARAMLTHGLAADATNEAQLAWGVALFLEHYEANLSKFTQIYDGLPTALEDLKNAGIALAICTNKPEALASKLIDELGWSGLFDVVVGGDSLPQRKPHAAPLLQAIERAGGGRAVFVGDSLVDAACGHAAGVPFIGVDFGFSNQLLTDSGGTRILGHYDELISLIATLESAATP